MERHYKGVKLVVTTGDITKQTVEAIVNPANSLLIMGGGVAGAIKRAGGKEIEEEALKHAPVPIGKAVATNAGKLNAKFVIHTPTMSKPAMHIESQNIKLAMKGALECAKEKGIKSIAFPGLGTGVGGFPPEEAAKIMMQELKDHIDKQTTLKEVIFVGFNTELTQAFMKSMEETFK